MSATGCLSRDELAAYLAGILSEERSLECEAHLAVCQSCRRLADELESLPDELIRLIRQPVQTADCLAEPEFQQALARGRDVFLPVGAAGRIAPSSPQDELPLPRRLGQYELLERIGRGGMGTVYKARHTMLQRLVAIKVLSGDRTESQRAVARFRREMKAIGALDHPHIVRASDAGEDAGLHYLVMDFVDGWHLAQLTQVLGLLPVADACEMAWQAALALQSIHEHGLVHRDVKPSNLMLSADGHVKLLDLGLGLLREETPQNGNLTDSGAFMGTCDYMAPEQCEDSHRATIQSDLYGLGCTLYELLCGHAPFAGAEFDTRGKKIVAHLQASPTPIRKLRPEASAELSAVLDRLLAKLPADRFRTPAELAAALAPLAQTADLPGLVRRMRPGSEALQDTAGKTRSTEDSIRSQVVDIDSPQPSPPATPLPQPRRSGRRWLALAAGVVVVLLLGVISAIQMTDEDGQAEVCYGGGTVWYDTGGDGIQGRGEPGVADAVVELMCSADRIVANADDRSVAVAVSDASGRYALTLPASPEGHYYLRFRTPVGNGQGYRFSPRHQGPNDNLDSDADSTGTTGLFTLSAGRDDLHWDAGLVGEAPGFGHALHIGSAADDRMTAVASDAAGNSYVAALFRGTVDLDPGPGTYHVTSVGSSDIVVAKYTGGGALVWGRAFGATGQDAPTDLTVDDAGHVWVVGAFAGTVDFDPGPGVVALSSAGGTDAFVLKLDGDGNLVWARSWGAGLDERAAAVGVDGAGNVYLAAAYSETADFDPGLGTCELVSAGDIDVAVSQLDADGEFSWAKRLGGTERDFVRAMAVTAEGRVCLTGGFKGTADFDPGPRTFDLTGAGDSDVFVAMLNSGGSLIWARSLGDAGEDDAFDIAVGPDRSVYITGFFRQSVDFDPGAAVNTLTADGDSDAFLWRLDSAGDYLWAGRLGGAKWDVGYGIDVTAAGDVYVTGQFYGPADLDPGAGSSWHTGLGGYDAFVVALTASGVLLRAAAVGGTGRDEGCRITVDRVGTVHSVGNFQQTANLCPGPGRFDLTSHGESDGFLTVWGPGAWRCRPAEAAESGHPQLPKRRGGPR